MVAVTETGAGADWVGVTRRVTPLLDLDAAKAQLNLTNTDGFDEELEGYVDAVIKVVERIVGPYDPRDATDVVNTTPAGAGILLPQRPVLALTALTSTRDGTAYPVADLYLVDALAGLVRRKDDGLVYGGPWTATYVVGRSAVLPNHRLAAAIIVQHLWQTQQNPQTGVPTYLQGGSASPEGGVPNWGAPFAIPFRALDLLAPAPWVA